MKMEKGGAVPDPRLQELNDAEKITRQERIWCRTALGVGALVTGVAALFIWDGLSKTAEGIHESRFNAEGAIELGVFIPISLGTVYLAGLAYKGTRKATQTLNRIEATRTILEQNGPETYPTWVFVAGDARHFVHFTRVVVPDAEQSGLPPANGQVVNGEVEGPPQAPPPPTPGQE